MSEHCYTELCFRMEDKEALSKFIGHGGDIFWEDVIDESPPGSPNPWIKVSDGMANYGWSDALHKASESGIVFYGYWGEASGDPSLLFVSFGGKISSSTEINHWPAVRLDDNLEPFQEDMKKAKEYVMLFKMAEKYVEEGPDALSNSGKPPA